MRKVLSLLLVFAVIGFAAQTNMEGDVVFSPSYSTEAALATLPNGFTMGDNAVTSVRDVWVGGDINGNGKPEVIVATYDGGGTAYVYEVTGDNTAALLFQSDAFGSASSGPVRDAKYGDLDGNGAMELIVNVNDTDPANAGLWVYEYDAAGDSLLDGFHIAVDDITGNRWYSESIFVCDVDQDSTQEVLVGNNGTGSFDNVYIGSITAGTFAAGDAVWTLEYEHGKSDTVLTFGGSAYGAVVGDMDGDGNLEALFSIWDHGALFIVEADAADTYTAHAYVKTDLDLRDDFAFYDFRAMDLDKDGRDEVYVSLYDAGAFNVVTCPDGTDLSALTAATNVHSLGDQGTTGGFGQAFGDIDGNGKMNYYSANGGSTIYNWEYQGGDPTDTSSWMECETITNDNFDAIMGLQVGDDLDNDGYDEIVVGNIGTTNAALAVAVEMPQDITETFDTDENVGIWVSANSGWTSRIWEDSTLLLSDAGWTIDGRRPILATPGTFFKATAKIKTGSFDTSPSQFLTFGVEGIAAEKMEVDCISEDDFTTFTVIGLAENAEGTLFINGQGAAGRDSVWIDEYTFEDDYMPGLTEVSTVANARLIADGDLVATKGIVTVSTQFGYAGPAYIQDETAGIAVYGASVAQNVNEGDEVLVVGEIDIYNGLVEVSGSPDVIVLSTGNTVVPVEVTYDDIKDAESYEGQLVVMKGCDTLDTGLSWAATAGSNKGFNLKDKNDSTFYCYVDKDTDIDGSPKPTQWPINITGVVGDYRGAQLLPRSLADWNPNSAPGPFTLLNPVDGDSISSLDDPAIVEVDMDGDSVKALLINWTEAVDNDALDTVTYTMMFVGDGPDDEMMTKDTFMYVPIDEMKPYSMNGTYTYYFEASDLSGEVSLSDTHTITFDFPAPPMMMYADIVLLDGVPTWYAQFDLPLDAPVVGDFTVLDINTPGVVTPTAVNVVAPNAVMVAAPMNEDGYYALVASGLTTPGADVTVTDTSKVLKAYIPFSDNHPEDAEKQIESFNTDTGLFWDPNGSGSTRGVLDASALAVEDSVVYNGAGAAALTLLDDPAVDGGWYVRLYHTLSHTVQTNSEILLMVKGVGDVDIRLSLKDTGYEQGPWKHVSLCENDWQVVSFDLVNDEAEGWITGNGIVEGETMLVEAIHIKSDADEDVVLFLDGFTERVVLEPVDITLNVIMKKQVADAAFNLATDFVDVAGTFNDWGGTSMILDDFDGDTTYTIVVPLMPYSSHDFKFRINGSWNDATAEFPYGGPARHISVRDYDRTYTYWYDDDTLVVDPDAIDAIPVEFALHQNYPNPFNPVTTINFDLPEVADVNLVIYDITGRKVRTLVNESAVNAGYLKINWNGRDDYGNSVSTGMYIYRLEAGDFVDVKKMTFLK